VVIFHDEGDEARVRVLAPRARRAGIAGSAFGAGHALVRFAGYSMIRSADALTSRCFCNCRISSRTLPWEECFPLRPGRCRSYPNWCGTSSAHQHWLR